MTAKALECFVKKEDGQMSLIGFACSECKLFSSILTYGGDIEGTRTQVTRCCNAVCEWEGCTQTRRRKSCSIYCDKHREESRKKDERDAFEKAKKLLPDDYDGECVREKDGRFGNDGFFDSIEELMETYEDAGVEPPSYCWATTSDRFQLNADSILESALEQHFEDAWEQVEAEDELKEFIKTWNEKQMIVTYWEDRSRAIMLPVKEEASII